MSAIDYPCGHDGCSPTYCQFYPDECAHGWRHDGSPGDHCDECLAAEVERHTVAAIVAFGRANGARFCNDVKSFLDAIERGDFRK